ncbi:hypothetical protein ACH4MW_28830 [Streptomyces luteogriseus]|uniref:hypothetical protein n=1 Tax=Streptomyces luteogriseus TaxID=68233 RepID=UPI0037BDF844
MRSARMLLATATATAALAIATPTAFADAMGDGDHDTTSYSKEHHKDGKHHKPHGGMHTGGGALSAVTSDDWDSSEQDKGDQGGKGDEEGKHEEHGKDDGQEKGWEGKHDGQEKGWEGKHDKHHKPHGGMHTGGGALASVNSDDWEGSKYDPDTYKDDEGDWGGKEEGGSGDKGDWGGKQEEGGKHDKGSWEGKHEKPRGGMHTGGGGLASAPGVTAGGLAVLAVAGTGLFALRRQKASQGAV